MVNPNFYLQNILGNLFQRSKNKDILSMYNATESLENSKGFHDSSFLGSKTAFHLLTHINDNLLRSVPNKNQHNIFPSDSTISSPDEDAIASLYQVFQMLQPTMKQLQFNETGRETGNNKSDIFQYYNINLPENLKLDNVNRSYSIKVLNDASKEVVTFLDNIKVRINSIKSDIRTIDEKIEQLEKLKQCMNHQMSLLNQNQIKLNNIALAINTRKDFVKEYNCGEDLLDQYLSESKNLIGDYISNIYGKPSSLPSISDIGSPLLSQTLIPETSSDTMSTSGSLSKFYDGLHKKQKYISISLQEIHQPGSKVVMFKDAHNDGITCLDFDFPFGTMITAGNMDHAMKLWNLSTKKQIGILEGHYASINCVQMDSNFNLVISGGKDATVRLWNINLATEEANDYGTKLNKTSCIHSFNLHKGEVNALSLDRETLVSASRDKTIKQWDLKTGKCVQNLDVASVSTKTSKIDYESFSLLDPPIVGALQCFETALATGSRDGMIRLWDLRAGKVIRIIQGHEGAITALSFDSSHLITGSVDQTVKLWDLRSKNELDKISFELPISNVHFDNQRIVVSTSEGSHTYDRISRQQLNCTRPSGYASTVSASQYKNGHLIEGYSNGSVTVWSV